MFSSAKTFKATDFWYSKPVSLDPNYTSNESYCEPVIYTSEMEKISKRLNHFSQLKNGWDGYNAIVPKGQTINNVSLVVENLKDKYLKLLNEEDIVPSSYGTITLYFEDSQNNELSVEFGKEYIGISGEVNGEIIIIDDIRIHDFHVAIENINKLSIAP